MKKKEYRLCYAEGNILYFSPDIESEWGDDWDDAPASCNAGEPYERNGECRLLAYEEAKMAQTGVFDFYSVEKIIKNKMAIAESFHGEFEICAGMTIEKAMKILRETGSRYGELTKKG